MGIAAPLSVAGEVGWGGFAPRPRVSVVESSRMRILSLRCAWRLRAGVPDSHTAMGFIALVGSRDVWGSPLPASARARSVGAASYRDLGLALCGELPREHLVPPLSPALAGRRERLPYRHGLHSFAWIERLGIATPRFRTGEVGWGGFAPQPRVSVVESYHVSILSLRCAWRFRAGMQDSHTAMGFIVLFGSRDWGSPLPSPSQARLAGAASHRDLGLALWRVPA